MKLFIFVDSNVSNKTYTRDSIKMNTKLWGYDSFVNINQTLIKTVGIDQYICPSLNNFTIAASYYSTIFNYIRVKVYRWENSTSSVICKSTADIENAVKVSTLRVPVMNTNFDFNNYSEIGSQSNSLFLFKIFVVLYNDPVVYRSKIKLKLLKSKKYENSSI